MYRRDSVHSSFCSASTAPTSRMMAPRPGKMPTTSVRLRTSLLSRSFIRPWWSGQGSEGCGWSAVKSVEVVGESAGDSGVPDGIAVPAASPGVGLQVLDVGELGLDCVCEFGAGDKVVAGLADVGVGAGAGDLVPGAVAVGDAGLEHFAVQPAHLVRDDR